MLVLRNIDRGNNGGRMQAVEQSQLEPIATCTRSLEAIEDEIAELASHMAVAEYRLLCAIRQFDEQSGYYYRGAKSTAHWLCWRIGLGLNAAREKVRVARALAELPKVSDSLRRGRISYSKVRALTRIATPGTEDQLLNIAEHGTASHIEKVVRLYRGVERCAQADKAMVQHHNRNVSVIYDEDGMLVLRATLPPEEGAKVVAALDAAMDVLSRATDAKAPGAGTRAFNQRRADALVRMAESALCVDAASPSRAERFQVVVHVDAESLRKQQNDSPKNLLAISDNHIENGPHLSAETCLRLSCDADIVGMLHDHGDVLDVGRKTRKISAALGRALQSRDGCCRFPGCTHRRYLQAHHVDHWAHGGETKLSNLLQTCSFHHRLLHEGGFTVTAADNGEFIFATPTGELIAPSGDMGSSNRCLELTQNISGLDENILECLRSRHQSHGIFVDEQTFGLWAGERMDYDWTLDWLLSMRAGVCLG